MSEPRGRIGWWAVTELEGQGLVVWRGEDYSEDVEVGRVILTSPPAGALVEPGDAVWVVAAVEDTRRIVPSVEGLSLDAALQQIAQQYSIWIVFEETTDPDMVNTVIEQYPDPLARSDSDAMYLTVGRAPLQ